ncbi:hypothetical protein CgunFtcFv8_018952 [Champsocephalus gunnari]|uniref:Uncharacterized protein n=1 Tax=Champsocephalus gunnari TaxID=52237 RepID=A0AAN8DP33_CHAGU|nr:hypothetical protein CgunFtcFv8_018952 [Champsocephalus gunnari]
MLTSLSGPERHNDICTVVLLNLAFLFLHILSRDIVHLRSPLGRRVGESRRLLLLLLLLLRQDQREEEKKKPPHADRCHVKLLLDMNLIQNVWI